MNSPSLPLPPASAPYSLTFCTTCRNRLWQIKDTLADNLRHLRARHNMTLVDYGSSDGLSAWVWSHFKAEIDAGKLTFFEVSSEVAAWHASKAKNLAHRIASGGYLFSLDADNMVVDADIDQIERAITQGLPCQQWSGQWGDGSYGRVGLARELFFKLGGYDEGLLPLAGEDVDLLRRLLSLGQVRKLRPPVKQAIQNSMDQKVAEGARLKADSQRTFKYLSQFNSTMSDIKLKLEGPCRTGGFSSFRGKLNGQPVVIDGFGSIHR